MITCLLALGLIVCGAAAYGLAALLHFAAMNRRPWDDGYPLSRWEDRE